MATFALQKIREDIASAPSSEHEASTVSQDVKKEQPQLVNVRAKKKNKHKKNWSISRKTAHYVQIICDLKKENWH